MAAARERLKVQSATNATRGQYPNTPEHLKELIDMFRSKTPMSEEFMRYGLNEQEVYAHLSGVLVKKADLWDQAGQIAEQATKIGAKINQLQKAKEDIPFSKPAPILLANANSLVKGLLGFAAFFFSCSGLYYLIVGLDALFATWEALSQGSRIFWAAFAGSGFLYLANLLIESINLRPYNRKLDAHNKSFDQRIWDLEDELEEIYKEADQAVIESQIKPELTAIINSRLTPSYSGILKATSFAGLNEIGKKEHEIETKAASKIRSLLSNLSGGSIGIAGPRGVGKTTILRSFCDNSLLRISDKQVVSVLVSAPVRYEARDFILHLFSAICRQYLLLGGIDSDSVIWKFAYKQTPQQNVTTYNSKLFKQLSWLGFSLGLFAFTGWLFLTNSLMPPSFLQAAVTTLRNSEFNPFYLLWATLGALVLAFWSRRHRSLMKERHKKNRSLASRGAADPNLTNGDEIHLTELQVLAINWLVKLRFQQSFSKGWSGSLQIPMGFDGGVEAITSISQYQLSLPEIVQGFREFTSAISEDFDVVIGIDELDKMQSSQLAQEFLNEIKSLFGIPGCFFLISVSEDALRSFELRSSGVRDAFDSSFDEIIYVDYLDFQAAKALLQRRVVGMPIPHIAFCYLFSGGLPRDLIRACRDIFGISEGSSDTPQVAELILGFVADDLKMKINATYIGTRTSFEAEEAFELVDTAFELERNLLNPETWGQALSKLLGKNSGRSAYEKHTRELAGYILFLLTLAQFFAESLQEAEMKEKIQPFEMGDFDLLARAKQLLYINPGLAVRAIEGFRSKAGLDLTLVNYFKQPTDPAPRPRSSPRRQSTPDG